MIHRNAKRLVLTNSGGPKSRINLVCRNRRCRHISQLVLRFCRHLDVSGRRNMEQLLCKRNLSQALRKVLQLLSSKRLLSGWPDKPHYSLLPSGAGRGALWGINPVSVSRESAAEGISPANSPIRGPRCTSFTILVKHTFLFSSDLSSWFISQSCSLVVNQ
jgi:hypothetical protein